jgi:hypothetical protein
MAFEEVLERFGKEAPAAVMARATLVHVLNAKRMDDLFKRTCVKQKCGELLFSTVIDLMSLVALKIKPSVNSAYLHRKQAVAVSVTAIYDKLQGIETSVSRAIVRETASELVSAVNYMADGLAEPVMKGFETRIVDGSLLAGTEHRIKELRRLGAAALPGRSLVVLDPDHRMVLDYIPCTDGHASECKLFPELLEVIEPGQLWIADRNFGTKAMLTSIDLDKRAFFIFRHSLGFVPKWDTVGKQKRIGRGVGGIIYEQAISTSHEGRTVVLRRITLKLDVPTRNDETEIHLLTNLPKRITAARILQAYRKRWKIENAFQHVESVLNSEIETLGYPKAALFSFGVSLLMYNILNVAKVAIAAAHKKPALADEISTYYLALDMHGAWQGLVIAVNDEEFESVYGNLTTKQFAQQLMRLGKRVNLKTNRKNKRGPKIQQPPKISGNRGNHVATQRILDESRA